MKVTLFGILATATGLAAAQGCNNNSVGVGAWEARVIDGRCQWWQCIDGGWQWRVTCGEGAGSCARQGSCWYKFKA